MGDFMRKLLFCCILFLLSGCTQQKTADKNITIVASFYPIYILTKNITDGVENVTLENMAQPQTGCLHDYQLTTKDRKILEKADLFFINGVGMESFLEGVKRQYQDLPIIDTSEGVELLHSQHHHEQEEHNEEYNGHIWLYSENALKQAENICNALSQKDKIHAQQYYKNLELFRQEIQNFQNQQTIKKEKVIVFHEGFDYIAKEYGFIISEEIIVEEEQTPSAKELAEMIDHAKQQNITLFFTADDEGKKYAELLAKEVGAKVYVLNAITSGKLEKSAYLEEMEQNKAVIQEAMGV